MNSSEFQDGNGNLGENVLLKNNKTAGNNLDSNGITGRLGAGGEK